MTQMQKAREGIITPEMAAVARQEGLTPEAIREGVAAGTVVIPKNINHHLAEVRGVGNGLRTKVNANIGTSEQWTELDIELEKARVAVEAGADALMDLSTGGPIEEMRRAIMARLPIPLGTVPIYQAAIEATVQRGAVVNMTVDDLFATVEKQAREGVDFATIHCGLTRAAIGRLQREKRVVGIVSRGGAFITGWMLHHDSENPFYQYYDRLLDIAEEHDVTLSLGDGLRPGCLADATDRAQLEELITLGELVQRAWERGVQVMVEGPGHVPYDQIVANIQLQKRVCHGAPFYVLGPLVTDVAPGYDHITSAIGGTVAAAAGADFLCYVTPAEHLGLPSVEDVREGVIASRIAAHAADLIKKVPGAWEWDLRMAHARKSLDWQAQISLALDPVKAAEYRKAKNPGETRTCTMCGKYCAMDVVSKYLSVPVDECC